MRRRREEKTKGRASGFARRLLAEWRRRGWASGGAGVVVAVSGGADSTALLLALDELLKAGLLDLSLTVAHLDHGLRGVESRADEMNDDERFARVRVRRRLVPLLETFNPRAAEALARTAELVREDAAALEQLAARLLEEATRGVPEGVDESAAVEDERACAVGVVGARPLRVGVLAGAAAALRRRALRQWIARGRGDLRRLELAHVVAVERLLAGARGGRVAELPGGARVERRRGWLLFRG